MTIGICNNSRVSPTVKQRSSAVSGDNEVTWIGEARSPPETVDGDQAASTAMSTASATASTSTPPRSPAATSAAGSVVDPVDSAMDDEDGEPEGEGDPEDTPSSEPATVEEDRRERASTTSPTASTSVGGTPPPQPPSEQSASTATSAPPRVRLKANLATDPALRAEPAISPVLLPTGAALDFLAALPTAFHSVLAGRLFLPPVGSVAPLVGTTTPPQPPQAQSSQPQAQTSQTQDSSEPRQGFRCEPCGIRYSSPRTLAAHQRYYCSHRQAGPVAKGIVIDADESAKAPAPTNAATSTTTTPVAVSVSTSVPSASQSTTSTASAADLIAEVPPGRSESADSDPANRRPKQYSCPHCSYSADKKVSLNRHMRMHTASPPLTTPTPTVVTASPAAAATADDAVDRYCAECDIRFSSQKTYRAHKTNYCRTRHILKADVVADASPPLPAPPLETAAAPPLLALPTSPVLLVPYSLIQGASLLPATQYRGRAAPDTACLLLPDGSLRPVATALPIGGAPARPPKPQPNSAGSSTHGRASPPEPTTRRKSSGGGLTSAPLDLSVRRGPGDTDDEDKMDDHEDIVCAPSIPLMLSAASSPPASPAPPAPPGGSSGQPSSPPETPPPSRKRPHSEDGSGGATSPVLPSRKSPRRTPNGVKPEGQYSPEPEMNAAAVNAAAAAITAAAVATYPADLLAQFASMDPKELQMFLTSRSALPLLLQNPPGFPLLRIPGDLPPPIPPPPSPQVLVKRGVSKCNECNIVFCKHETYLAHKKNYCSARLSGDDAGTSMDHAISPVASPPPATAPADPPPLTDGCPSSPSNHPSKPILEQYICMACNIRYSSRDTLHAHQTYYCRKRIGASTDPKLIEIEKARRRCVKCKVAIPSDKWSSHHCEDSAAPPSGVPAPASSGWRCPCCPVNSPTAAAAQRHMETHSSVRAFRCTLCGYKGNTLRGMRTHIRVHLVNKGITDPTEENYITCVLEDEPGSAPLISAPSTAPSPSPARPISPEAIPHPEEVYVEERKFTVYDRKGGKSNATARNFSEEGETACNGFDYSIKQEKDKGSDDETVTIDEFKVKMEPMDTRQGSPDLQRSPSPDGRLSVEPKEELNGSSEVPTGNNNQKTELQYCKSCHLSFNYYSTFVQHKKMHCENHQSEGASGSHTESVRTRTKASAL